MSKNSWEKAFGIADAAFELPGVNNDMDDIKRRQREIQQNEWDKKLSNARKQSIKEVHDRKDEEDVSDTATWAEMYKNVPAAETATEVELSVEEQILKDLERSGHFYKSHGTVGSVKMLITELDSTRRQLSSIKRALGK